MTAAELMTKLRYEDDLAEVLGGAVIVEGAAGRVGGDPFGGAVRGFVVISEHPLAEHVERICEIAQELADDEEVHIRYVRATT
jgi:hypothetical protein